VHSRALFDLFVSEKNCNDVLPFVCCAFISDGFDELMPNRLNTSTSAVDSEDPHVNMPCKIVKQSPEMRAEISANKDKHNKFSEQFCKVLTSGVREDSTIRTNIVE